MLHDLGLAADHQAVAAVETEDAAARADVDVLDPLRGKPLGAIDVVAVVAVAAVDDDVAGRHQRSELVDGAAGDRRGDHHPDGTRAFERRDELLQRVGAPCALGLELCDGVGADVEDDAVVPVAHEPAHDVGAHAPQSDHSELHLVLRFVSRLDFWRVARGDLVVHGGRAICGTEHHYPSFLAAR